MNCFGVPKQCVTFSQGRGSALKILLAYDVAHQLLIAAMMERDVEVAAIFFHVNFMTSWIHEKPATTRNDVFGRNPNSRHRADMFRIQIISVLMWPCHWISVKIHTLNQLAWFTENQREYPLSSSGRKNFLCCFPK